MSYRCKVCDAPSEHRGLCWYHAVEVRQLLGRGPCCTLCGAYGPDAFIALVPAVDPVTGRPLGYRVLSCVDCRQLELPGLRSARGRPDSSDPRG